MTTSGKTIMARARRAEKEAKQVEQTPRGPVLSAEEKAYRRGCHQAIDMTLREMRAFIAAFNSGLEDGFLLKLRNQLAVMRREAKVYPDIMTEALRRTTDNFWEEQRQRLLKRYKKRKDSKRGKTD